MTTTLAVADWLQWLPQHHHGTLYASDEGPLMEWWTQDNHLVQVYFDATAAYGIWEDEDEIVQECVLGDPPAMVTFIFAHLALSCVQCPVCGMPYPNALEPKPQCHFCGHLHACCSPDPL